MKFKTVYKAINFNKYKYIDKQLLNYRNVHFCTDSDSNQIN